ncbi:MAG: hypothetical protein QXF56_00910 [Candidatus Micrarchaeia archaeon]
MDEKLIQEWKQAISSVGGVGKFEKDVLPLCSHSVRVCWERIVKAQLNSEVKAQV